MKIARLASLIAVAIVGVSLMSASAAFAEPEFLPTGQTVEAETGVAKLSTVANANTVTCKTSHTIPGATVVTKTLVGGIVIHFLECVAKEGAKEACPAKSAGAPEGLILTKTLHGVLGLILPKTGTGVGLLLLPATGSEFVKIEAKCTEPEKTAVTGNVVGEVSPVREHVLKGKLIFTVGATDTAAITDFDLSTGGLVKPELVAYSTKAGESTEATVTYGAATEVS